MCYNKYMSKRVWNITSEGQSGGTTAGIVINDIKIKNTYIWRGRKEGFFSALFLALVVEIIIRLIFKI